MEERFKMFTVLIAGVSRCIRRIKTGEMAEFQLGSTHVSCLYYLSKAETMTAKELCEICEEDKANISRSIKYLEENGFIACTSRTRKRYLAPLCLTEKGKDAGRRISEKIDRILDEASEGLSEEERTVFYRSLALIHNNLQKICAEYDNNEAASAKGNQSDDE